MSRQLLQGRGWQTRECAEGPVFYTNRFSRFRMQEKRAAAWARRGEDMETSGDISGEPKVSFELLQQKRTRYL
jgi:hypothetical protein